MKNIRILMILFLGIVVSLSACNNKDKSATKALDTQIEQTRQADNAINPSAQPAEPAQNASGVWHYTCEKGCAGGAGKVGNCASCGGPLLHNQAYHTGSNANANTTATDPMTLPPPKTTEPAQNGEGVWHYTCAKGCSGGAGTAGACVTCGGALAHNPVYHL